MTDERSTRGIVIGLLLVVAAITAPGLVLAIAGRSDVSEVTALAAVAGLFAALSLPPRVAVGVALALGPAAALTVVAAGIPWLAGVVMATAAGAAALTARWRVASLVMMSPIFLAFLVAQPPLTPDGAAVPALGVGVVALGSAAWAVAIGLLLRRAKPAKSVEPLAWGRVRAYAAVLAVTVGIVAVTVVARDLQHGGAWFLLTILVVLQPDVHDSFVKTWQRAGGTLVGFVLALAAYAVFGRAGVIYLVAVAFLALAILALQVWHRPYWQAVAMLTPAIVLFEGASGSVVDTALERLGFTLLGVLVAVLVELAMSPLDRATSRKGP